MIFYEPGVPFVWHRLCGSERSLPDGLNGSLNMWGCVLLVCMRLRFLVWCALLNHLKLIHCLCGINLCWILLLCTCWWARILSGDGFHLWLLGALVYLTLFVIYTVENSWGVKWILIYFTSNIQSFGFSLICVVCNIDETGTRSLKLATKWNNTYLCVVDFVFFVVKVCTCDCWAR